MNFDDTLDQLLLKHKSLSETLSAPDKIDSKEFAKISKEYSSLAGVVDIVNEYKNIKSSIPELEEMLNDPEMRELAFDDLQTAKVRIPELEKQIKFMLIPQDKADSKNAIVEIRAGTGGDEAALFAGDLLTMYQRFAQKSGLRFEIMSASESDMGGFKEIFCTITGENAFLKLKFESGVHRVQRVPNTETSGRIHTSAATVAVLPEAEDVDITIEDKDLRIDVYRAQGAGGQHVNKTESAVRITHIPTGVAVAVQDEKSQHKNKARAMKILKSRLYEAERQKLDQERASARKGQVGTGDRSEKIRTYNFPQDRITDHRISKSIFGVEKVINEGGIDELISALIEQEKEEKLAELGF